MAAACRKPSIPYLGDPWQVSVIRGRASQLCVRTMSTTPHTVLSSLPVASESVTSESSRVVGAQDLIKSITSSGAIMAGSWSLLSSGVTSTFSCHVA